MSLASRFAYHEELNNFVSCCGDGTLFKRVTLQLIPMFRDAYVCMYCVVLYFHLYLDLYIKMSYLKSYDIYYTLHIEY